METAMHDLMAELTELQIGYAQTVVAYLDDHPDVASALLASIECSDRIGFGDEKDSQGIIPAHALGSYIVGFREFLYPRGCSHGQWILGIRRVKHYLKTGSYLEEWEIES